MKFTGVSLIVILSILNNSSAYKILVYNSKFGHSNVNFYGNIADILVDAGHDVTSLMPEIDPSITNGTVKSKVILVPQTAGAKNIIDILRDEVNWFDLDPLDPRQLLVDFPYGNQFAPQCAGMLEQTELIDRLKEDKFDVMIAENFDMCGIGLVPLIRPKALINGAASAPLPRMNTEFGIPLSLSTNPSATNFRLDTHSFFSRLKNVYAEALGYNFFASSRSRVQQAFRDKFGPDYPSLTEISSHAAYTIINSEPLLDFATPILNRIVYVGGLGARDPKPLNQDLDKILSLRDRTVLISFGSIVKAHELDDTIKPSIIETTSRFPDVTFMWKYEQPDDDFAQRAKSLAPNLHLIRWIPQNDMLADRRLTAFVTHAGMGSTQELALRGKPGLFIPIFGDQMRNAGMMERSGVGKVFDKRDLGDWTKLTAAIEDLLENETYRINAQRLAAMIAKKPFSAREQLIKTVEFAAEFGASPALRPESYDMNWMEYNNLDIIAVFLILKALFVFSTVKIAFYIIRRLLCMKVKLD
ncbi:hypothetical protein PENTCL1PPCAC_21433 [Pristionchus entomophagus]|uniref:glucuronosyltransferase n=1 Tax=Pristionchus entomophagus TaxID=358040 RepID=A0AAV5TYV5_9BILA|nr:hypothetical protein PENTCL1PPCAC_21433 [Pristionchus entomophagus]